MTTTTTMMMMSRSGNNRNKTNECRESMDWDWITNVSELSLQVRT